MLANHHMHTLTPIMEGCNRLKRMIRYLSLTNCLFYAQERTAMTPPLNSQIAPFRTVSRVTSVLAAIVIVLFFICCVHTAKSDSVTWDESQHLYSGWLAWERGDFGYNPEVPPLVKCGTQLRFCTGRSGSRHLPAIPLRKRVSYSGSAFSQPTASIAP